MKYVPFLKLKANEVRAVGDLDSSIKADIVPFFDVSYIKGMTDISLLENLLLIKKGIVDVFGLNEKFYIDNLDHNGEKFEDYNCILNTFFDMEIIPVVGLDRNFNHIKAVKDYFSISKKTKKLAIRFLINDIQSFRIIEDEIDEYLGDLIETSDYLDIIIDIRVIESSQVNYISKRILKFIQDFEHFYECNNIIITSSSISSVTNENIKTNEEKDIERIECLLWNKLIVDFDSLESNIVYGDYTVISPDYVEPTMSVLLMPSVMVPKVFYTYQNFFFAIRGSKFKTHPLGFGQYFGIAGKIANKTYYRGAKYSSGEKYISDRAQKVIPAKIKSGNPSSWIRATVNSHITFMTNQF